MSCARCGCGIYKTEEFISLNKVWHKNCFSCFQCNIRLDKDCAKIFQGELFCDSCYTCVIEKLFEVISTPSFNKPCKVVSSPSCAVKDCEPLLEKICCCKTKEYCFPAEKKNCIQRTAQSCSCIPTQSPKNEYCFVFPIPREVANYYNRSHMRSKSCKTPITCCSSPQCPACSCRKSCYPQPKCSSPKNKCCCNSCSPPRSKKCCCCPKPLPPPCIPVFKKGCDCCLPKEPDCCNPCTQICPSPCQLSPCSQKKCCKSKCSPVPWCPQPVCCCQQQPTICLQTPAKCCSPRKSCFPPVKCCCSPPNPCSTKCCSPPPNPCSMTCPPQPDPCCPPEPNPCAMTCCSPQPCGSQQPCSQNLTCCCKNPVKCCCNKVSKYCVCGNLNPCNCKMSQIRAQCIVCCNRCNQKVYAAEKIVVSSGAYHTSCFTCYCCNKCLDIKNVFEGCGEIYCKQCYNYFFGCQYYGFGRFNC